MMSSLHAVTVNWNLGEDTVACVESLFGAGLARGHAIVVDNGSTDGSVQVIETAFGDAIHVIRNDENRGYAAAANAGVRLALQRGAEWVFLLNNDTTVDGGLFEAMSRVAGSGDGFGLLGPLILYDAPPRNRIWYAGDRVIPGTLITARPYRNRRADGPLPAVVPVEFLSGCGMLVHRGVFDAIGYFDERLFMYGEEIDFCRRARIAGFRAACVTGARMWHRVSATARRDRAGTRYLRTRNQVRFYRAYARGLQVPLMWCFASVRCGILGLYDILRGAPDLCAATWRGWAEGWFASMQTGEPPGPENHCNLCGRTQAVPVCRQRDLLLDREDAGALFVRCRRCGLVCQAPMPAPADLTPHYPPAYDDVLTRDEQATGSRSRRAAAAYGWRRRVRTVTRRVKHGRLLDVGCGTGGFLQAMQRIGGWELQGVETRAGAARAASDRLGVEVRGGTLKQAEWPAGHFDVVTLWDVLEHVHDPTATLTEVHRILKPGGLVVARVPNGRSWEARLFGAAWAGLDAPRHLYVFDPVTLRDILTVCGFRPSVGNCPFGWLAGFALSLQFALVARRVPARVRERVVNVVRHPLTRACLYPLFLPAFLARRAPSLLGVGVRGEMEGGVRAAVGISPWCPP